ncbi:MAG: penicillin-binding protein [Solirubrobacteraceae bacterium]|nr:penicillin-binding protein [Solirubrobacteraceae bacterium]
MSRSLRTKHNRLRRHRPRNKALLGVLVVLVLIAVAGLSAVGYVVSIAASAPSLSSLKERDPGSNSEVLAADGSRLGFIQASELRLPAQANEFPKILKDATVAIEDRRFYQHKGVDYEGVVRAALKNLISHKTVQGGSTITMQLARNLYISKERTYTRKIREAKVAEEIESQHSKQWILAKYLNTVPYGTVGGQSAIGAKAAARIYFNKRLSQLTLREAALLAGLPQAPSLYSPLRSPQAAMARRNDVLKEMASLGLISQDLAQRTARRGLGLNPSTYFTRRRESFFFDYVKDELIQEYGAQTVRLGGLQVRTTVDLKKQQEARAAIQSQLAGVGPSSAIVTINPANGYIEAMASSADYGQSKFNLAAQGHRQPGSTFKVMALMAALRAGVDPDATHYVSRSPIEINDPQYGPPFKVETYDGRGVGNISLRQATLKSDNSVYIQLALDIGPDKVKQAAWDLGIRSELHGYPAETLGGLTNGVSPLEMANAYATIASGGMRNRPTAITKVTFPDGHSELPDRWKVKRVRAFEDGVTAKATEILEQNIQKGTGVAANIGCPAAGKTGTTDKFTDAWFVGFTPRLATAVWVGYPAQRVEMQTLFHGGPVAGGTFPAQIWAAYMKAAKGKFCGPFPPPTTPFQAQPFFGKYSTSGGGKGKDLSSGSDSTSTLPGGAGAATPAPTPGTGGATPGKGKGKNGKGKGFDPNAYESPPQPPPATATPAPTGTGGNGNGGGGGTQAPSPTPG